MQPIRIVLTILFVLSNGAKYSLLNPETELIEDLTVRRGVEDFMNWCPYTKLCTIDVNVTVNLKVYFDKYEVICCDTCSCEEDCDVDCCPDMAEEFLSSQEIQHRLETDYDSCVYAQYKNVNNIDKSLNALAYDMITKCPSNYEMQDIAIRCDSEYIIFDFNEDIFYFGPVMSTVSNTTFQNAYCAECHNISRVELKPWLATLQCLGDALTITSIKHLPDVVIARGDCNIWFTPVFRDQKSCIPVIETCNVTGKWAEFDPFLQRACHSYKSVYEGYRNVHCYICNGHIPSSIFPVCLRDSPNWAPMSYIALLDLRGPTENTPTEEPRSGNQGNCTTDTWYDPLKDRCQLLHCSVGMRQVGTQCVPIYKTTQTPQVFEFHITLSPNNRITTEENTSLFQLNDAIARYANDTVANMTSNVLKVCSIHGFLRLGSSLHEAKNKLFNQSLIDVRQVSYRMNVEFGPIANMTATIEELESHLRPEHFQQYSVQNRRFARRVQWMVELPVADFLNFDLTDLELHHLPIWLQFGFQNGFDNREDGIAVLPLFPVNLESLSDGIYCENGLDVEIDATCAKIILSSDDIQQINNRKMYVRHIDEYIDTSNVIVAENGTDYLICVKRYNSLVNKFIARQRKNPDEKISYTPLVLLTIICIALSLVALVATLVAYGILPQLRTLPGKNIMALVVSLTVLQTLMLINASVEVKVIQICQAIGITLHFSLLSSFFWMFVCTAHTLRVITSLTDMSHRPDQTRLFIKYILFTEGVSSVIVLATICKSLITSGNGSLGYGDRRCYLNDESMVLYTVSIPGGLVVVTNLVMFIYLVIKLARMPDMKLHGSSERRNIVIFAKLSTITGLTWIFGYLYQFFSVEAFAYIFVVLNASQGIFILLSFVANKRVYSAVKTTWSVTSSSGQLKTTS